MRHSGCLKRHSGCLKRHSGCLRRDLYGRRFGSKYVFWVTCHDFFVAGDEKSYFPPKLQTLRGEIVPPQNPLVLYTNRYTAALLVGMPPLMARLCDRAAAARRLLLVAAVTPRRAVTPRQEVTNSSEHAMKPQHGFICIVGNTAAVLWGQPACYFAPKYNGFALLSRGHWFGTTVTR